MSNARALLLLPLAACMLALAAVGELLVDAMGVVGFDGDVIEQVAPWLSAVFAGGGFVLLVVALGALMSNVGREQRWRPYLVALKPLAGEFGRGLEESARGIEFEIQRDGQRLEILVDPRSGGGILVSSRAPARQPLAWLRASAPPLPAPSWRDVERTLRWQLCAELPVMARPLLADSGLMGPIERFFEHSEGVSVMHTVSGIVIESGLVPAETIVDQVRLSIEIAFRLRRLNG
ncbi:MAG: hypothetical protein Q8P18_04605 [Pseudomonadota bacterium]|nr:hypothetical protein [Pseudomonadota bacterium]